ncbi:MAG: CBM13 / GH5_35, partial [uncultured Acidimicrobiales bacterium]
ESVAGREDVHRPGVAHLTAGLPHAQRPRRLGAGREPVQVHPAPRHGLRRHLWLRGNGLRLRLVLLRRVHRVLLRSECRRQQRLPSRHVRGRMVAGRRFTVLRRPPLLRRLQRPVRLGRLLVRLRRRQLRQPADVLQRLPLRPVQPAHRVLRRHRLPNRHLHAAVRAVRLRLHGAVGRLHRQPLGRVPVGRAPGPTASSAAAGTRTATPPAAPGHRRPAHGEPQRQGPRRGLRLDERRRRRHRLAPERRHQPAVVHRAPRRRQRAPGRRPQRQGARRGGRVNCRRRRRHPVAVERRAEPALEDGGPGRRHVPVHRRPQRQGARRRRAQHSRRRRRHPVAVERRPQPALAAAEPL